MDKQLEAEMRNYLDSHANALMAQFRVLAYAARSGAAAAAPETPAPAPTPAPAAPDVPADWVCLGNLLDGSECPRGADAVPHKTKVLDKDKGKVRLCVSCRDAYKRTRDRQRAAAKKAEEPKKTAAEEPAPAPAPAKKKAKVAAPPPPPVEEDDEEDEDDVE